MNVIRPYNEEKDFEMVKCWWSAAGYPPVWKSLLPLDTTFVLEADGIPALCACLYLMNSPDACMIENMVSNPEVSSEKRHIAVSEMFSHLESEAKRRGYKTVVLFSPIEKLQIRYMELGFVPTATNVTTFSKAI